MIDPLQIHKYSDKILEIIDNQEQFTRGDLQGAVEAVVMNIILEAQAEQRLNK